MRQSETEGVHDRCIFEMALHKEPTFLGLCLPAMMHSTADRHSGRSSTGRALAVL